MGGPQWWILLSDKAPYVFHTTKNKVDQNLWELYYRMGGLSQMVELAGEESSFTNTQLKAYSIYSISGWRHRVDAKKSFPCIFKF